MLQRRTDIARSEVLKARIVSGEATNTHDDMVRSFLRNTLCNMPARVAV